MDISRISYGIANESAQRILQEAQDDSFGEKRGALLFTGTDEPTAVLLIAGMKIELTQVYGVWEESGGMRGNIKFPQPDKEDIPFGIFFDTEQPHTVPVRIPGIGYCEVKRALFRAQDGEHYFVIGFDERNGLLFAYSDEKRLKSTLDWLVTREQERMVREWRKLENE